MNKKSPIGVFDSGMGGISVLASLHTWMPNEDLIYFGDSKYNPYGTKTKEEITARCMDICNQFMQEGVKAIVIACNTATSACVPLLREKYPVDIIGMEPALKVACSQGMNQKIAVWATELTLQEKKFSTLMQRFQDEHEIRKVPCPKLVRIVEEDALEDEARVKEALLEYLEKSDAEHVDSIVLGCTHFVFYKKQLEKMVPKGVRILDGNAGTVHHLQHILESKDLLNDQGGALVWKNTLPEKIELSKKLMKKMEDSIDDSLESSEKRSDGLQ